MPVSRELLDILACPRDGSALAEEPGKLRCENGHSYPVVDDIPVMLVLDKPGTHWVFNRSIRDAYFPVNRAEVESVKGVDPFVQETIVLVAGLLYRPLLGKLTRYPSVSLDIEPGNGKVFLDIGSSWGRWTLAAAKLGYRAIGIDPNLDAVKAAHRIAAQQNLRAEFVVGDARALPVRDSSIDVAFSYSVFQHFPKIDVQAALKEIRKKLSPTGYSLIQMANRAGARSLYHQAWRHFREADGFDVRYWSIDDLQKTFIDAIGPSEIFADCYFGLGIRPEDADMLPVQYRMAVMASETLRKLSERLRVLQRVADSVFVRSRKAE